MLQGIVLLPCLCSAKTKQMPLCLSLARAEVIFIGGGGGGGVNTQGNGIFSAREAAVTPSPV